MARVTQEHTDARRKQILVAAARQFGLKGMEPGAATIDDIAMDAGLSKGSIYSYYKNKDELMEAISDFGAEADAEMFATIKENADTAWDAFWAVSRHVWDLMLDPEKRELQMLSFERLLIELRQGTVDPRFVSGPVGELTESMEGAQQEGKIAADIDPHVLATMLWNCQQGTRAYILRTGDAEMANAILDLMKDLISRTVDTQPTAAE